MKLHPTHVIPTTPGRELRVYVERDVETFVGVHIREHAIDATDAGPVCEGIDIPRGAVGPLVEALAAACTAAIRLPAPLSI